MGPTRWYGLAAALLLAGCGQSKPDISEDQALQSIGFSAPIPISIPANGQIDQAGNPVPGDSVRRMAVMLRAGVLQIVSNANAAPWWTFAVPSGTSADGAIAVPAAYRVVTGRSEEKSWSEGSVQYYAETIAYTVKPLGGFDLPEYSAVGPFSVRLMMKNDPTVGHWVVLNDGSGNYFDRTDSSAMTVEFSAPNQDTEERLKDAIKEAQQKAYGEIEEKILAAGPISRATVANELINTSAKIAYYTLPHDFPDSARFSDIRAYCSSISPVDGHNWRVPTLGEMTTALVGDADTQHFADTPDHRIWGNMLTLPARLGGIFVTDSWARIGGPIFDHLGGSTTGNFLNMNYAYSPNGNTKGQMGHYSDDFRNPIDTIIEQYEGQERARVICVRDI